MHHQPDGPAFDVVLIVHVACVVVSLATLAAGVSTASRLRTVLRDQAAFPESVARYFRPGTNWAGRSVYGVPVFGFLLLALSHGSYSLSDGWIMGGLFIFVVVILVAEGVLWPAERRLQVSLVPLHQGGVSAGEEVRRDSRIMVFSATSAIILLVVGSAIMLVQP